MRVIAIHADLAPGECYVRLTISDVDSLPERILNRLTLEEYLLRFSNIKVIEDLHHNDLHFGETYLHFGKPDSLKLYELFRTRPYTVFSSLREFVEDFPNMSGKIQPHFRTPLSDREKEVAEQVARGLYNKEVAARLFIAERTVKNHLLRIFDKAGVQSRDELSALIAVTRV